MSAKHLVVVGYSGRDLDVMPLLRLADRITWLHFQPPGGGSPPALEVQSLAADFGRRMQIASTADPFGWIAIRLPAGARTAATTPVPPVLPSVSMTPQTEAAFDRVRLVDRRLAVARVLMHINEATAVTAGLRATNRSHRGDARVHLRTAEALIMTGDRGRALQSYLRAERLARSPQQRASALLGSASVRAGDGLYSTALTDLRAADVEAKRIREVRVRRNPTGKIAAAYGRVYTLTGDDAQALRHYRQALTAARRNHDLDMTCSALIFGSDVYRSVGNFRLALEQLEEAFADNELYVRPFVRGWGSFYRGLARCSAGDVSGGLDDLQRCRAVADQSGNGPMLAWALLALSSYSLINDVAVARQYSGDCGSVLSTTGRARLCEIRLAWHQAELERAAGDLDAAAKAIDDLRVKLQRPGLTVAARYLDAHLCASEGEIARERGNGDAADRLRHARGLFLVGNWRHGVTRMDVSLWLAGGRRTSPSRLLARCRREGYGLELSRLRTGGRRPLPLAHHLRGHRAFSDLHR